MITDFGLVRFKREGDWDPDLCQSTSIHIDRALQMLIHNAGTGEERRKAAHAAYGEFFKKMDAYRARIKELEEARDHWHYRALLEE